MAEPHIVLPDGISVSILQPRLAREFSTYPPETQREAVRMLEEFSQEVRENGSLPQLITLGLLDPRQALDLEVGDAQIRKLKLDLLDTCSWQLAQFLRYSTPSRIGEAVPPLEFLQETYKNINGDRKMDVVPTLYLGVALSRHAGEEERAIRTLAQALDYSPVSLNSHNNLWARANMARLLRDMNCLQEAQIQEEEMRHWILGHPFDLAPGKIRESLIDDVCTGAHILDHPSVVSLLSGIKQVGPNTAISNGMFIQYRQPLPQVAT